MPQDRTAARVWDLPTRLFHWLLVALFGFSWWSAEAHHLDWHQFSGLAIFGLLVFRILWGFVGAETARFSHFLRGPRRVWAYLHGEGTAGPGHNPLGGWSVMAMLTLLCVQVIAGLFAVDVDGIESGPLSYLVDFDQGRAAAAIHSMSFNVLLALIVLHIGAILFYLAVKDRNLIKAMVSGGVTTTAVRLASRWTLLAVLMGSAVLTYGVANGFHF